MSSWHSKPLPRLLEELDARPGGLSQHQAEERLRRTGPNELEPPPQAGLLGRLLEQMRDPMILVLLGAAGLSLAASGGKEWLDAAIILVIVAVNSVISIFQEDRAQHALEELRRLSAPQATVLRGGRPVKLPAAQLVPGDVILLEAGDLVPADARILECSRIQADESAMTGESIPVEKAPAEALAEGAPLGDWTNMVISGTLITAGRGTALVCATGMDTQMGHIAGLLLGDEGTDTPLQQKMGEISRTLSFLCLSVCAVMFGVGLIQGKRMLDMFLTAVSLAVAAIPEGLPAIVTIVLALGVGRMAAQGDPTEGALIVAAAREGLDRNKLDEQWPRQGELPFDSSRKLMSTIHPRPEGGFRVFVKGAPDVLLERCAAGPQGVLTPRQREGILRANEEMAGRALRVLGVASRDLAFLPPTVVPGTIESGLTFLGLFGMMDPPRPEVREAVALCHRAGVRPVMITGDHKATALAVARELDIYRPGDLAVTGAELEFLPQEALEEDIHRFSVFARVSPEHKMRIVKAWQKRGCVVAMTGDGVNDAPALKAADIGCAMGRSGTDVAKGAADLILTDDNFSTIVSAIEEGRGIWSNIRKAIHYLLSCNIGEILTIFTATLLDFGQMPLAPVQLLWLNLVTDSLPALALGVEPVEEGAMEQPPRPADRGLFDRSFSLRLAWQGLMVGGLTLAAYFLGFTRLAAPGLEGAVANTMAFATLTLCQLFHAFNVRSEDRSLLEQGLLSNPAMNKAFLAGASMQLAVLLFPPLQSVFSVVPMDGGQWLTVLLLAAAPIPICELAKALGRRREMAETRGVPPDHGTGRPVSGAGAAK